MASVPGGLTATQQQAVSHRDGPLLITGGAGAGKTETLLARFVALVAEGARPESLALLAPGEESASALRAELEGRLTAPYEELAVMTFPDLCARLLRGEAAGAGIDPFAVTAGRGDRVATLLEHIDELPLRHHDIQGNPAALLAGFVERIDALKGELIDPDRYARWAAALPAGERAEREREFAAVYETHDRLLAEAGLLDAGELAVRAVALLGSSELARERAGARWRELLVDELEDLTHAQLMLVLELAEAGVALTAAGEGEEAIHRLRAAGERNFDAVRDRLPETLALRLEGSLRCPRRVLEAARAVVDPGGGARGGEGVRDGGEVEFWRCSNERAQAQSAAADVERLIAHEGADPPSVCVLVRSLRREGREVAVALEERAVPYRMAGAAAFFERAEVRDVLAWLRLLADPGDASAVVRALARPPIELRSIDIARITQIARRRRIDMVAALAAATESPQVPPEAREHVLEFLKLYRSAAAALDRTRPDLFVHRLIERLGLRRRQLFSASAEVVERLVNLARFGELAARYVRRSPQATPREFARYIAAVADAGVGEVEAAAGEAAAVQVMSLRSAKGRAFEHVYVLGLTAASMPGTRRRAVEPIDAELLPEPLPSDTRAAHVTGMRQLLSMGMTRARRRLVLAYPEQSGRGRAQPSPFVEQARSAVGAAFKQRDEELFGPAESLHSTFRVMRDELLETLSRTAARLGELRLDTDLDVSHAVVRYLEVLKLAALIARPSDQSIADALGAINQRLAQAVTPEQREIFETSMLDDFLLDSERDVRRRADAVAQRDEPSLDPFLPRRGEGLVLSATDVETYRVCPLRYKFARVFRIPQEPTLNQRFGILFHQVLQRFHESGEPAGGPAARERLLGLLEAGWRRAGLGDSEQERQLRAKAEAALERYLERFAAEGGEPVWIERNFAFRMGPHLLRGRVDRVDRLPDGAYELIDFKTGRPRSAAALADDVQLSLYALGAREAWELDDVRQAYWYVLDDEKVPVERGEADREWLAETVSEVAEGILGQNFEPTPSHAACSVCDYRLICPAAER